MHFFQNLVVGTIHHDHRLHISELKKNVSAVLVAFGARSSLVNKT